jgi:chromate reductase
MLMAKSTVAVIVGSLRKDSMNLKLAKAIAKLGKDKFDTKFLDYSDLPVYNQDLEESFPASATRFKKEIEAADAILFVTPEYNRGMPGPLKNAIDWASRPYGKNSFAGKPAGSCGASPGAAGTAGSQANLKPVFSYLDLIVMGQPELYLQFKDGMIDSDGNVPEEKTQKFLQGYVDKFASWIEAHGK